MAIAMSAALFHAMELVPKMNYDARLYVELHRTLYRYVGPTAGVAEFLATLAVITLTWRVRAEKRVFLPTAISAALMLTAHVLFYVVVQPANTTMAAWSLEAIPAEWTSWRDRWEYGHAARAGLILVAFCALMISALGGGEEGRANDR
jgi:hypothetical protein